MSYAQQRLWFLDRLNPNDPAYNVLFAFRISGELNPALLEEALNLVADRQETLRTTFDEIGGTASQIIHGSMPCALRVIEACTAIEAEDILAEEARRPFSLTTGSLLRALLVRGPRSESFLLTAHHIVCDGWSGELLLRELGEAYSALASGQLPQWDSLEVQYREFSSEQRAWMDTPASSAQIAYWRERLRDAPSLVLPYDRPRAPQQSFRGGELEWNLSQACVQALREFSRRERVTVFMTLLAAYTGLLHRYSGQDDFAVGVPVANRTRPELEPLVGFFANTLVMRADASANPTFRELVSRVQKTAFEAYRYQEIPFERLVEELSPDRSLSHNPLFQVTLAYQNYRKFGFKALGVEATPFRMHNGTSKFDLALLMTEREDGISGVFEYSRDLFEEPTIRRMASHLETLLEAGLSNPGSKLSELPLMSADERKLIDSASCGPVRSYRRDRGLHELIETQALHTPDAPALQFGERVLSYAQLLERSGSIARQLRESGAGTNTVVGVLAERSIEMVAALLGIMRAGAAYLPLDPGHPHERIASLINEFALDLVVTQGKFLPLLDGLTRAIIAEENVQGPTAFAGSGARGIDLAYVILTSGSTGAPKGAMNTHAGICNRLLWMQDQFGLTPDDRVLQKTPYTFDVSVWEFFWPLLSGACLVVAEPEAHRDCDRLVELIETQRVSVLHFVPSMLQLFTERADAERCRTLRLVICSGEALPYDLEQRFGNKFPFCELHNLYGPTEAAVDVTHFPCSADRTRNIVPIGRPIANTQIRILDKYGNPTPFGVAGELHIGGVNVGLGYYKRPDLTRERFLPDPFTGQPGDRLYKSGDVARLLPDGDIEYLGRADNQVKIRGIRIEPGEIEAVLDRHPAVRESVVVACPDSSGGAILAAFVAPCSAYYSGPERRRSAEFEHVRHWGSVFAESVGASSGRFAGWNSSYDGQPIPAGEMEEWLEDTLEQIRDLRPERVLEIGCGSGLIAEGIAPECEAYCATDPVDCGMTERIGNSPNLQRVSFRVMSASETLSAYPAESFDTVILNSVVQYFPNREYLIDVLIGAFCLLRPGGSLFLGDIRHLGLLEEFHRSVELERRGGEDLASRVRRRVAEEKELLVHPALFTHLRARVPSLDRVAIRLKQGKASNELTRFRYNAILTRHRAEHSHVRTEEWSGQQSFLAMLDEHQDFLLRSIPNARLRGALGEPIEGAIEPHQIVLTAKQAGMKASLFWSADVVSYDVLCTSAGSRYIPELETQSLPFEQCTNDPLRPAMSAALISELRSFAKHHLPDYMVPSLLSIVEAFQTLSSGKVDRRKLAGSVEFGADRREYTPPVSDAEQRLAKLWSELLGLPRVGLKDHFFDAGGHSLLATRLISRIRDLWNVEIPLRTVFEMPVLCDLARYLDAAEWIAGARAATACAGARQQGEL
jgi:amino acid adenylation domain-containing protein